MKENEFQKDVIKAVEAKCAYVINIHGHAWQKHGLPDLHIMHRNWTGWLELKCEDYEASTNQRIVAAKIQLRGIPAWVLRCREINSRIYGIVGYKITLESFAGKIIKEVPDLDSLLDILVEVEGHYHDAERQMALDIKKLQTSLVNTRLSNSAGWHDLVQENKSLKRFEEYSYYVGGELTCNRIPLKFNPWVASMKEASNNPVKEPKKTDNNSINDNDGPACAPWLRCPQ